MLVEGQTEERFARSVLAPHLLTFDVVATPIIVHTGKHPDGSVAKGGGRWIAWRRQLGQLTRQHSSPESRFTTLLDLYGFPTDFPGHATLAKVGDTTKRAEAIEAAIGTAIGDWRLIPYVQRHEVEALVLVGLDEVRLRLDSADQREGLDALRLDVAGLQPEDVNDDVTTAPSKRLLRFVPGYRKAVLGPPVLEDVGLARLRAACPRFGRWVAVLEGLGSVARGAAASKG